MSCSRLMAGLLGAGSGGHPEFVETSPASTTGRSPRCATGVAVEPDQPVAHRVERRAGPRRDTDLGVDPLQVAVRGLGGDAERAGDLLDRPVTDYLLEHLELARSEAVR